MDDPDGLDPPEQGRPDATDVELVPVDAPDAADAGGPGVARKHVALAVVAALLCAVLISRAGEASTAGDLRTSDFAGPELVSVDDDADDEDQDRDDEVDVVVRRIGDDDVTSRVEINEVEEFDDLTFDDELALDDEDPFADEPYDPFSDDPFADDFPDDEDTFPTTRTIPRRATPPRANTPGPTLPRSRATTTTAARTATTTTTTTAPPPPAESSTSSSSSSSSSTPSSSSTSTSTTTPAPTEQWVTASQGLPSCVAGLSVGSGSLLARSGSTIYTSADGGTWTTASALTNALGQLGSVAAFSADAPAGGPVTILAVVGTTLQRYDGTAWTDVTPPGMGAAVGIRMVSATAAALGTSTGVFVTSDGGLTWTAVHTGAVVGSPALTATGTLVWLQQGGTAVVQGGTSGAPWTVQAATGIPSDATGLAIAAGGRLVAASPTAGVVAQQANGSQSWQTFGPPLPSAQTGVVQGPANVGPLVWTTACPASPGPVLKLVTVPS